MPSGSTGKKAQMDEASEGTEIGPPPPANRFADTKSMNLHQEGETSGSGGKNIHQKYSMPVPAPPPPPPPPPRPVQATKKVGRVPRLKIGMFITQKMNELRRNWSSSITEKKFESLEIALHTEEYQPKIQTVPPPPPPPSRVQAAKKVGRVPAFLIGMFITKKVNYLTKNWSQVDEAEVNSSISGMEKKLESLEIALHIEDQERPPKIQRVPPIILNDDSRKYFGPKMFSIGPYHHNSRPDFEVTEKVKLKLAALFLKEHRLQKNVVYFKIRTVIKNLREYYVEENKFEDDDDLAWIFFVDGCAVLHYIHCAKSKNATSFIESKIKVDCLTFMQEDLFLLENQLPFPLLELLMSLSGKKNEIRESIEKFIIDTIKAPKEKEKQEHQKSEIETAPIHLLDLLRTRLLQSVKEDMTSYSIVRLIKKSVEFIKQPCEKLKDLIECIGKACENPSHVQTHDLQFFRSIEELEAAGIRLRPSNTGRLTDITFNLGTLKLPPIVVDGSTAFKFLNLIAYEMCPDFVNDFGVSSYIFFLDALIDRAQDVKELRDRQILYNALGSDEEVAQLFNVIGTNLVSNPEKYSNVKSEIQKRYCNKWMTWIFQFIHQHFQSPWSILAFVAAIIVVVFTVFSTIYTVLGYYE